MKIEVGESLACSYLRHVKHCWIVQTNWKAPEHWRPQDAELEARFSEMKCVFDSDGSVFKKTKGAAQFLKQAEIDLVGVDQHGGVHAMEVAFHEDGLNYREKDGSKSSGLPASEIVANNVLKKMLRTYLILRTNHPQHTRLHIYFLSPKVQPAVQQCLDTVFVTLQRKYADVEWCLLTNDDFTESVIKPTLDNTSNVADSSELFVRSAKLLEAAGYELLPPTLHLRRHPNATSSEGPEDKIQPLVQALMRTLLVDHPSLLSVDEKTRLTDKEYCKKDVGLKIGNHALIRGIEKGKEIGEHPRYWTDPYGDFYVCKEWQKSFHCDNARSLLVFVKELIPRKSEHGNTLRQHAKAFCDYLAKNCS